jgi:FeS assembly SUF system regulator
MIRIGKLTDYAFILLGRMASVNTRIHAAAELSEQSGVALPTVSKVLKTLARAGIVRSVRGAHGGYVLAGPPENFTLARIIDALEGPIALTECAITESACQQAASCGVRGHWSLINQAIRTALESVTMADLIRPVAAALGEEVFIPASIPTASRTARTTKTE